MIVGERADKMGVMLNPFWSNFAPVVIIDREAREIMYLVTSVRLSVRLSVSALTAEPFDL